MEAAKPAGKRPRTKYDTAFRTEAVCRVTQDGQAVWDGPVKADSVLREAELEVTFELVRGAVAEGGMAAAEVEVGHR